MGNGKLTVRDYIKKMFHSTFIMYQFFNELIDHSSVYDNPIKYIVHELPVI